METGRILFDLLIIFAAGKLAGELFERMHQPAVIGELMAGIIIGPGLLGWASAGATLETVATMGVVVLMFVVGLETKASDLFRVGPRAMVVGSLGVVVPFIFGFGFGAAMGYKSVEAMFIGTALVATSVGITARVLADRGLIGREESRIILAAAVIDDILGMIVLSAVTGVASGGVDFLRLGIILAQVVAFIAFELWVAPRIVSRHIHLLDKLRISNAPLVVSLIVMLALATLAQFIGLAGIIGAFFAGMMFAETCDRTELDRQAKPIYEWLVPYFFVVTGMRVEPALFLQPAVLVPGLVLTALALGTKVVGCGVGALGIGWRRALAVGVGMIPRGEVGLIVATVGLTTKVISPTVYAMVIMVVIASTLVVPPILPSVLRWADREIAGIPVSPTLGEAGD